jgi:hypothetical protein
VINWQKRVQGPSVPTPTQALSLAKFTNGESNTLKRKVNNLNTNFNNNLNNNNIFPKNGNITDYSLAAKTDTYDNVTFANNYPNNYTTNNKSKNYVINGDNTTLPDIKQSSHQPPFHKANGTNNSTLQQLRIFLFYIYIYSSSSRFYIFNFRLL